MTFLRLSSADRWLLGKLLALFLVIVGAKLVLMSLCSSPLPFFDQWQAEGKNLLLPWLDGNSTARDFFAPHNDHRILWTRLMVLGLFLLNHQWDAQVEMIAAAALHAACAVVLGWIVIRRLGAKWETPVLVCLVLIFALPFDWEDTLSGGFQSQFYFLILFSIVTIWGLAGHAPLSAKWGCGVVAAICAWFSIASGPLATVAVGGWMTVRLIRRAGSIRANAVTLAVSILLTLLGLSLRANNEMPGNLKAESLADFLSVFAGLLSWPAQLPVAVFITYLPFAALLGKLLWTRSTESDSTAEDFILPLGFWVICQATVLAYVRNRYGDPLQISRYMVFLPPGVLVNLACVAVLARGWTRASPFSRRQRLLAASVAAFAAGLVLINLGRLTSQNLHDHLPMMKIHNARQRENIAAFLASGGNPKIFEGKTVHDLQSEYIPELMNLLRNPLLRGILPSSVQTPMGVLPEQNQLFELVARKPSVLGEIAEPAWKTDPSSPDQVAAFRSQELTTNLPYLELAVTGRPSVEGSAIALVSGNDKLPILAGRREPGTAWSRVIVKAPSAPFHLEAVCRGGDGAGFAFTFPRPVGWLSAWAQALLDKDAEVIFAGLTLWLALAGAQHFASRSEPGLHREISSRAVG